MSKSDRNPNHYVDHDHPYPVEYLSGSSQAEIAYKHSCSVKAVESVIRRRRLPTLTGLDERDIIGYFSQGKTLTEIAKILKTNIGALDRLLRYHNIKGTMWQECRARAISGKVLTKDIAYDLYINKKWSAQNIAAEYGFSSDDAIRRRLREWSY